MNKKLGKRKSEEREIMVKEKQLVEGGGEGANKKKWMEEREKNNKEVKKVKQFRISNNTCLHIYKSKGSDLLKKPMVELKQTFDKHQ